MAQVRAAERQRTLAELNQLAADIVRCEKTINSVMAELNAVNAKFQGLRTTRDDVEYLTVLLDCAKKKLAWEKQISGLKKRAPALLEDMMRLLNDKDHPPADSVKAEMLGSLQAIQSALERLQATESPG
jgi:hypothetical protein